MGIVSEFKEFAVKGNAIDLAVGLIIGAEFGKIVNSIVNDLIMPPIGWAMGGVDFRNIFFVIKEGATPGPYLNLADAQKFGAVTWNIGNFITTLISFIIIAIAVFMIVKAMNKLKGPALTAKP